MLILAARTLLPVSQPPIRDGALLVDGTRIRAVGGRSALEKAHPGARRRDLGDAILLPGLVNVHTHLELSVLRDRVPPGDSFVDWVLRLLELRRDLSPEATASAVDAGIAALIRAGTTCVGEVTSSEASFPRLRRSGLRGVVYREVIGLDDSRADEIAAAPFAHLDAMRAEARGSSLEVGVSPHAPYSVSPKLLERCRQVQCDGGLKATIHAAESRAEVEYLRSGTGEIRTRLLPETGWGDVPPPILGATPVAYLDGAKLLGPACLLVHAVHLTEEDVAVVARSGAAVAHCPRSNEYLAVGRAPLKALRDRRVPVGLGTDSLASSPSLSLWDEIRAAWRLHGGLLSPAEWIGMATAGGARALGLDRAVGTLEPGKRADCTALALDAPGADPYECLLHEANPDKVLLTVVDGTPLYERQEP